jgi:UDP-3-O-[3-hydroxymyristoyl] N-acetylglucosamine deacetylase
MDLLKQKTLAKTINFNGVGLHSGKTSKLIIKPAKPNTGIIFKRIDLLEKNLIYPNFLNVTNTSLNTTVSNEFGNKVSTIEHLMGALFSFGVDNALIEIDNEEVPILDGSAKIFVNEILNAGLKTSDTPVKIVKINKTVEFKDGDRYINIHPSKLSLDIEFELKYNNPIIGNQKNKIDVYRDGRELDKIINSRTFCLYEDIETIKKQGLAKGGSLENAIVVKGSNILNKEGLRNSKEFVNHKILDCVGDLFTCGFRLIGSVKCSQGGHYLTNMLLRKIFNSRENFSLIEINSRNLPHTLLNNHLLRSVA